MHMFYSFIDWEDYFNNNTINLIISHRIPCMDCGPDNFSRDSAYWLFFSHQIVRIWLFSLDGAYWLASFLLSIDWTVVSFLKSTCAYISNVWSVNWYIFQPKWMPRQLPWEISLSRCFSCCFSYLQRWLPSQTTSSQSHQPVSSLIRVLFRF